jgi:putative Mn2+ efflux pump MntP
MHVNAGLSAEIHRIDMTDFVTFLVALGLALDAFSVALVGGVVIKDPRPRYALRMAFFFGLFQAVMPVIGWAAGGLLTDFIGGVDHWIAFALLCLIGIHMMYESFKPLSGQGSFDPISIRILLLLSLATSIDALAVGISLAFVEIAIIRAALIIGTVTFVLSFVGFYIGHRIGRLFGNKVRILGGIILIGIGVKILIDHLG